MTVNSNFAESYYTIALVSEVLDDIDRVMIGFGALTLIIDVEQVTFSAFEFDCTLNEGVIVFTGSALPDELVSGVRAGKMRSALCNNTL